MKTENIFEVNETKSVAITERQLTELMAEATSNCIKDTHEHAKATGKKEPAGLDMLYIMIGAEIAKELRKILFKDSDT